LQKLSFSFAWAQVGLECVLESLRQNTTLQSLDVQDTYINDNDEGEDDYVDNPVIRKDAALWAALASTLRCNAFLNNVFLCERKPRNHDDVWMHPILDALRDQPRYHPLSLQGMDLQKAAAHQDGDDTSHIHSSLSQQQADDALLLRIRCAHQDKLTAFLMASHTRLGADSACTHLSSDCVHAIVMCFFGLPLGYVDQISRYREYKSVLKARVRVRSHNTLCVRPRL
jgi:hypothetical protein